MRRYLYVCFLLFMVLELQASKHHHRLRRALNATAPQWNSPSQQNYRGNQYNSTHKGGFNSLYGQSTNSNGNYNNRPWNNTSPQPQRNTPGFQRPQGNLSSQNGFGWTPRKKPQYNNSFSHGNNYYPNGFNSSQNIFNPNPHGLGYNPSGYNSNPNGHNPKQIGFNSNPNGYNSNQNGFSSNQNGFNSNLSRFNSNVNPSGYNPNPNGFNPYPNGFNSNPIGFNSNPNGNNFNPNAFNSNPEGYNSNPNGFNSNPNGNNFNPNAFNSNPGGYSTNPNGFNSNPNGNSFNPNAFNSNPGGYNSNPGGYNSNPGGYNSNPNGFTSKPNGYDSIQNGNSFNPNAFNSHPSGYNPNQNGNNSQWPPTNNLNLQRYRRSHRLGGRVDHRPSPNVSWYNVDSSWNIKPQFWNGTDPQWNQRDGHFYRWNLNEHKKNNFTTNCKNDTSNFFVSQKHHRDHFAHQGPPADPYPFRKFHHHGPRRDGPHHFNHHGPPPPPPGHFPFSNNGTIVETNPSLVPPFNPGTNHSTPTIANATYVPAGDTYDTLANGTVVSCKYPWIPTYKNDSAGMVIDCIYPWLPTNGTSVEQPGYNGIKVDLRTSEIPDLNEDEKVTPNTA